MGLKIETKLGMLKTVEGHQTMEVRSYTVAAREALGLKLSECSHNNLHAVRLILLYDPQMDF